MHVQPVDLSGFTVVCPECRVLQNVDVIRRDEEVNLLAGQRCWYCGQELTQEDLSHTEQGPGSECKVVCSGYEVPFTKGAIHTWAGDLAHTFGSNLVDYDFDKAGRCVITLHRKQTADDLDVPVE